MELEEKRLVQLIMLPLSKMTPDVVLDVIFSTIVLAEENASAMILVFVMKNTGEMIVHAFNAQLELMERFALDLEHVIVMEPVLVIVFIEKLIADVSNAKENQDHVLDTEPVTAMVHVHVNKDGLILTSREKSVIVRLNVKETVLDTEYVNAESVNVTLSTNFFQTAHAKIAKNNVLHSKCVTVMENVLVYLVSLEQTA